MRAQSSDSGTYACEVRNEAGEAEGIFDVLVLSIINFNTMFLNFNFCHVLE